MFVELIVVFEEVVFERNFKNQTDHVWHFQSLAQSLEIVSVKALWRALTWNDVVWICDKQFSAV